MSEQVLQRLIIGQLHQLDRDAFGAGFVIVDGKRHWQCKRIRVYRRNIVKAQALNGDGSMRFIKCGETGQADLYGVLTLTRGLHFEIEVKRKGKKRTPEQIAWGDEMRLAGALYIVAYSLDDALTPVKAALGIA